MTHYVVVALRTRQRVVAKLVEGHSDSLTSPCLFVGTEFDEPIRPGQVLWVDGSADALRFAAAAGYKTLEPAESRWEVMRAAIFKDRGAAGGRATKGVTSPRKARAVRRNGRLGGRPVNN